MKHTREDKIERVVRKFENARIGAARNKYEAIIAMRSAFMKFRSMSIPPETITRYVEEGRIDWVIEIPIENSSPKKPQERRYTLGRKGIEEPITESQVGDSSKKGVHGMSEICPDAFAVNPKINDNAQED